MRSKRSYLRWCTANLLALSLCAGLELHAQIQGGRGGGGGGGGFGGGGGGGGGRAGGGSSTSRQYFPNGTVGDALISVDPDTHKLIVITDDETSQYVGQVITNLDRPKPQVLIKVVFLEVTYNNSSDIGVEGSFTKQLTSTTTGSFSNVFGLASQGIGSGAAGLPSGAGLYQVLGKDFQATLRAIAQAGKTEILSRPSVLARNNQPAEVFIGSQVPLVTGTRIDTLGGQINTFTYQKVGIQLDVTPFISDDGMVEMIVTPQTSELSDQTVTVQAGVNAPVISQRSADTVVVTPDGQTVIIGGLIQNSMI